jgi:hypothetical protein
MTISDYLKRRTRRLFFAMFAVWLCMPLTFAVLGAQSANYGFPWPILWFVAFGIAGLMLARTKCPRCNGPLYGLAGNIAFRVFRQKRVRFCPYCGVDFDEPMESPPSRT